MSKFLWVLMSLYVTVLDRISHKSHRTTKSAKKAAVIFHYQLIAYINRLLRSRPCCCKAHFIDCYYLQSSKVNVTLHIIKTSVSLCPRLLIREIRGYKALPKAVNLKLSANNLKTNRFEAKRLVWVSYLLSSQRFFHLSTGYRHLSPGRSDSWLTKSSGLTVPIIKLLS